MKLSADQLAEVVTILEKIDAGKGLPRAPERMGRFLRQYRSGRARISEILAEQGIEARADAAVSGLHIGAIEIHPVAPTVVRVLGFPLGEVAETVAISEQLGAITNVVMWLTSPIANAAYNFLRNDGGVRLTGDYRWTPAARLTPGESRVETSHVSVGWQDARCLKAVSDDLDRPPHAVEYFIDYRLGSPGIKYFRCVCVLLTANQVKVLPGLSQPRPLELAGGKKILSELGVGKTAMLLIYREPWSNAWTIVAGIEIDSEGAAAHAIAWADFQRELDGSDVDGAVVRAVHESLSRAGIHSSSAPKPNMTRSLLPAAKHFLGALRKIA